LLHAGYSRRRALLLNVLSAGASGLGAIAACISFDLVPRLLPYFLALAAASFLYVAMADLIPTLHRGTLDRNAIRQLILIGLGVATIVLL
jgi:zinc and cadmium transporter